MKGVKTGIILEHKKHGDDLMRRLAEIAPGLEFIYGEEGDFTITDEIAAEYFPVSCLAEHMARTLGSRFTSLVRGPGGSKVRTYVVRSSCGGSGCTSLALTIARILAGRSGGQVAFVTYGPEIYDEGKSVRCSQELMYLISHNYDADVFKYVSQDRYGVSVLAAGDQMKTAAEWLQTQGFSAVVTDGGTSPAGRSLTGQAVINMAGAGDRRAEDFEKQAAAEIAEGSGEFYVLNRAPYKLAEGRFVKIPEDGTSFSLSRGKIEIAMDREYAAAVRELVSMVEKDIEDGQSDFYK